MKIFDDRQDLRPDGFLLFHPNSDKPRIFTSVVLVPKGRHYFSPRDWFLFETRRVGSIYCRPYGFYQDVAPTALLDIAPTALLDVAPTALLDVAPTALIDAAPTELFDAAPTELFDAAPTELLDAAPTELLDAAPTELFDAAPFLQITN